MWNKEGIRDVVEAQRVFFRTGCTLDVSWRRQQLKKLRDMVVKHEKDIEGWAYQRALTASKGRMFPG